MLSFVHEVRAMSRSNHAHVRHCATWIQPEGASAHFIGCAMLVWYTTPHAAAAVLGKQNLQALPIGKVPRRPPRGVSHGKL